jgi:hypothetical integral membrane protein (TIGR02206 family)
MPTNFQLFGAVHLAILSAVLALAGVFAVVQRQLRPGTRGLRLSLGTLLLLDSVVYYGYLAYRGQLTFPNHLPLELCDASLVLTIVALLTLNRAVYDLAYYWALAGATMALLTPNLWEPFPSFGTIQFFVDHGLIVASVLFLAWSGLMRPRAWSVGRAMLVLNLLAVFIGAFDYTFKTDYMYLRAKPQNASLLDLLGPWPWYIVATEFVAFLLFVLLYLPFRKRSRKESESALPPFPVSS